MIELKIAQYNVWNRKDVVMAPLIRDAAREGIHILALQEPWQNPHMNATYCPSSCGYWPVYPPSHRSRACLLVSKALPRSAWVFEHPQPDIVSVTLQLDDVTVHVHSIYSPSPEGLRRIEHDSPVFRIPQLLQKPGEHILVGDFNLHHPNWGGTACFDRHDMADELIRITQQADMRQLTPPGTLTWKARGASSTIDLAFATPGLARRMIKCGVDQRLEHGSDHLPVTTEFAMDSIPQVVQRKRSWKKMDKEGIAAGAQHLRQPGSLNTAADIEAYVEYLFQFMEELVSRTVPMSQPARGFACPWWTEEVQEAVRAARSARRRGMPGEAQAAEWRKRKVIQRAKTAQFRQSVHEASKGGGIWKLVRWAKERSHLPPEPPIMPTLRGQFNGEAWEAVSAEDKAERLRAQFFPEEASADLSDIEGYQYPQPVEQLPQVTPEMVGEVMSRRLAFSAPGVDGIPNAFLKAMGKPFEQAAAALTQACWDTAHHPLRFRKARTVALRKHEKGDYTTPRAWRPIALLSTVGKIIEAVTAQYLRRIAEQYRMLPEQQMGGRESRSAETALDLLTNQVRAVWDSGDYVASILALDITGAFDRVLRERLVHVLLAKGVPARLTAWIRTFMSERSTTIVLAEAESKEFQVPQGVPQGSPLSPILYLFYTAELLEACNSSHDRLSASAFIDDTTLLAYGPSTERNCRTLERAHESCLKWAHRYGASFAPDKYDLIHLSNKPSKFNMRAPIRLGAVVKNPETEVRILGVWIDPQLKWGAHVKKVLTKMETQANALYRTTASTWGATFTKARQIYSAVVRPALAYGAAAWHSPTPVEEGVRQPKGPAARLEKVQNKCLRSVTGAYRATPVAVMETEAHTPPLSIHLDARVASFRRRHKGTGMEEVVTEACRKIRRRLNYRLPQARLTAGEKQSRWADQWFMPPGGTNELRSQQAVMYWWKKRWGARPHQWGLTGVGEPSRKTLRVHRDLKKAESAVLTQVRTGRIGLAAFLNKVQVPAYPSPLCRCGQAQETAVHVIAHCQLYAEARRSLWDPGGRVDVKTLVGSAEGAQRLARWIIGLRILPQFNLAGELLYGDEAL